MAYSRQLREKRNVVVDLIERVGGFRDVPIGNTIPSPRPYGYRNTARFLSSPDGALGYTDWRSNRFMRADVCPIMSPEINAVLRQIQGYGPSGEPVRVRHSEATGEIAISPELAAPIETGQPYTIHELLGRRFRVSALSFFQVNTPQAEQLIRLALEGLRPLEGKVALDAYCGAGTFTRFLAEEAAHAIGIEESHHAVADAGENLSGLGAQLIEGRTEEKLPELSGPVDLALLDPPRSGCESPALEALLALAPERIVYVSCDPATLARDLKFLCSTGAYTLTGVQPVDMFPQTSHIEAVATLHGL